MKNKKDWKTEILFLQQKAISKWGEKEYVEELVINTSISKNTLIRIFDLKFAPNLKVYFELYNLINN